MNREFFDLEKFPKLCKTRKNSYNSWLCFRVAHVCGFCFLSEPARDTKMTTRIFITVLLPSRVAFWIHQSKTRYIQNANRKQKHLFSKYLAYSLVSDICRFLFIKLFLKSDTYRRPRGELVPFRLSYIYIVSIYATQAWLLVEV